MGGFLRVGAGVRTVRHRQRATVVDRGKMGQIGDAETGAEHFAAVDGQAHVLAVDMQRNRSARPCLIVAGNVEIDSCAGRCVSVGFADSKRVGLNVFRSVSNNRAVQAAAFNHTVWITVEFA